MTNSNRFVGWTCDAMVHTCTLLGDMTENSCQKSTRRDFAQQSVLESENIHVTDECDGVKTLMTLDSSDNVVKKPEEDDVTPRLQEAWDDVRGRELNPDMEHKARRNTWSVYNQEEVWTPIPRAAAIAIGWKVIGTR